MANKNIKTNKTTNINKTASINKRSNISNSTSMNKKSNIKHSTNINKNSNINKNNNSKMKKKKRNFYFYADIAMVLLLIIGVIYLIKNHNKNSNNNNNNSEIKNDNKINENVIIEEDPIEKEKKEKLKKLGNINEKITFFKDEYLDRYLDYKEKHPDLDDEKVIVYVNVGLDRDYYTNVVDSPNKHTNTVLVNKYYNLGKDYVPNDLIEINSQYSSGGKKMAKEAALAFEEMAKAAKQDGYNVRAVSTYRSYSYQNNLYTNYAKQDGKEKADTYSARPGYSEHQTGLAVDVDNKKISYTKFGNTKEFIWMKENCYKYGFILRYTKENEFITGYMNEPWHYRYVGKEIAKYIYENPMTYEEYYVRFLDNN